MTKHILISGGSGMLGTAIQEYLQAEGHVVAILSRQKQNNSVKSFYWDYENGIIDQEAIAFADIIIHLAGENISAKRWTAKQKHKIIESRVKTSELLYSAIKKSKKKPEKILSASAIGYYGSVSGNRIFKETDEAGTDFLAETVVQWEAAVDRFTDLGVSTCKLRIGVVMSGKGGALQEMIKPLKMGFASKLASGKQYIPWISIDDLAKMFVFLINKKDVAEVYNAVNPSHINNQELTGLLAKKYNKPMLPFGIPSFVIRLIFGEMSVILLEGSRVSSQLIQDSGFEFKHSKLNDYLDQLP